MDILVYVIVLVMVALVVVGGVFLKRKFNVKNEELNFVVTLLELVNYINKKFEYKYKDDVSTIMEYVLIAIDIVEEVDDIDDNDYFRKKELMLDKAKEVCMDFGLDIDDGLEDIINEAINFVIDNR